MVAVFPTWYITQTGYRRKWVQSSWTAWNESLAMGVIRREVDKRNTGKSKARQTLPSTRRETAQNSPNLIRRREKRTHMSIWVNQVTNCFVYIKVPL